jgi:Rad52/22 family double-strand break repair protein
MGFSAKQVQALRRRLSSRHVRTREAHGRELCYIEGWYAIAEANRIFGFDAWSRETVDSRCVLARENRGSFLAVYVAKVRITVHADGVAIVREGHGSGEGRGTSPGEVHDIALKAAETDATPNGRWRRSATRLDSNFIARTKVAPSKTCQRSSRRSQVRRPSRVWVHTPTIRHRSRVSHYYGRRHQSSMTELLRQDQARTEEDNAARPPLAPVAPPVAPHKIDKSQFAIAEPKRLRDKAHLKFVVSQPCLVCGRQPSDPHHLRFAQPRAIGLKVSDEFTVPLCRGHHRQLHQAGNEVAWWQGFKIEALHVARRLWEQSHARERQIETESTKQSDSNQAKANS